VTAESSTLDLAPFLRGVAWPGTEAVAYPRADPADASRLPGDTWGVAQLPVGVRLEFVGPAIAVEIDYSCGTADLGYRGAGGGITFALWRGDEKLGEAAADPAGGTVRLAAAPPADDGLSWVVHLPEAMKPRLLGLRTLDGHEAQAPDPGPRWLAYGDSITEGWIASEPGLAWPAIVGRRHGLDVVNLGYAGAARGEIASAEQLAAAAGDVISVFYGTNCWSRTPTSADMIRAGLRAFLAIVRQGHPDTPLVVVSQLVRPDAESTPNRLGATMHALRAAIESTVQELADPAITLVPGVDLVTAEQLPDGIHPGDEAQWVLADVIGRAVISALR
jgi:lysophospholipase L1-like esterase